MSTSRQTRVSTLHGEALLAAQRLDVAAVAALLYAEPELLTETGGLIAGSWFARPEVCHGHELVAAGLLLSGPIDRDELAHWITVGFARSAAAGRPYGPALPGVPFGR